LLGVQLVISQLIVFPLLLRAGKALALRLGVCHYEALAVGFALGMYGCVSVQYILAALSTHVAIVANKRGRIALLGLWFFILSGPTLFGGGWLCLQPFPNTTWYGRLIYVAVAIAMVIAGVREVISSGAHAARPIGAAAPNPSP
jgi:hypothetical protein